MVLHNKNQILSMRNGIISYRPLLHVFDHCITELTRKISIGLAMTGSLTKGTADQYSDLDFQVVIPSETSFAEARSWVIECVSSAGQLLASFPATHLGLPNLLIFFLQVESQIVKVDVHVLPVDEFRSLPQPVILFDPEDQFAGSLLNGEPESFQLPFTPNFADLYQRFSGWTWYTYTKLARGECLEAADALDTMRSQALLPCLQFIEHLPFEGYRRLETRLSEDFLLALRQTYPSYFQRDEILRALKDLVRIFSQLQPLIIERLGQDYRQADLQQIFSAIERMEAVHKG
ncbi:aminoglycoside 6-adenylyltransferase [Dictyobacter arantiisoli]|uniref:Oxalate:formate antiporter n=1 Tax=Dictyobacter arantiisoli TaxID=2014874 RepID=A0A5A5TI58_9CHLR|nr:aminoglycoside 6-adenylyltransferase [Dictyobacter arantiisoli]GCF11291.1 oxalate:formate antiporter [Dictyobacter arantiisoli]